MATRFENFSTMKQQPKTPAGPVEYRAQLPLLRGDKATMSRVVWFSTNDMIPRWKLWLLEKVTGWKITRKETSTK